MEGSGKCRVDDRPVCRE